MGNTTRCPKCNKWGNPSLDNYCRLCDLDLFKDKLHAICGGSTKILIQAVLEVGANSIEEVKRWDRSRLLNIVKNRQPIKRRGGLVQNEAPLESYGYAFVSESTEYKAEKGVPAIEGLE